MGYVNVHARSELTSAGVRRNSISFEEPSGMKEIYWQFSGEYLPFAPADMDFALIALLPYVMNKGLNIRVEGTLTRSLIEGVEECMDVWVRWRPDLFRKIQVDGDALAEDFLPQNRDAIMMFSGGVDSTFTLVAHKARLLGNRSLDLKAGVMVHGFDVPLDKPEWFRNAVIHAKAILSEHDVGLTLVETNWRELSVDWEMGFGFGLFAILHQFHGKSSYGVLSTDEPYGEEHFPWGNNSITNPLLSGLSFPVRSCGGGQSRTERVAAIASSPAVRSHIRVCWERPDLDPNCGECE